MLRIFGAILFCSCEKLRMQIIDAADDAQKPVEEPETNPWIERELEGCRFTGARLGKRLGTLMGMISGGIGESIPAACQDWAGTKAACRFLSNKRVSEEGILAGHFQAAAARLAKAPGPVLILHDTTEFSYARSSSCKLGVIKRLAAGKTKGGRVRHHTLRGILMHSSLAVSPEGVPLGLAAIKFWTRKKFKGCNALKRWINPTRMPIERKESHRWLENMRQSTALAGRPGDCVHIGDRESDIYELFCLAQELGTSFLVRTCVDRLAGEGYGTVSDEMRKVAVKGTRRVKGRGKDGKPFEAVLEIKLTTMRILPPVGKQKKYPGLILTVIHAVEKGRPKGRERIQWKLLTNLPVPNLKSAIKKLKWYAMR